MSDTPMLELLAYVMRDPEWAASEITILQRELAAAAERIAELEESRALLAPECREWREEAMAAGEKEGK